MRDESTVKGQANCCLAFHPSQVQVVGKLDENGIPVPLDPEKLSAQILRMFPGYDTQDTPALAEHASAICR
jgi:predicted transcriptional regulator